MQKYKQKFRYANFNPNFCYIITVFEIKINIILILFNGYIA